MTWTENLTRTRPGLPGGWDCPLPDMVAVRQSIPSPVLDDACAVLRTSLDKLADQDWAGKRIAITAGSRGIPQLAPMLAVLVDWLKGKGADPFIVPSMGSHGGASAEGQVALLAKLGVTEDTVGAPISLGMETVSTGVLDDGTRLFCDKHAHGADGIILFNKIKPHTSIKGAHESGLMKMSVIGLGKADGARAFHAKGFRSGGIRLEKAALHQLKSLPVVMGVGIVENADGKIAHVEAIPGADIPARDTALLADAKTFMGGLPFKDIDVLVIDQAGKNFSGTNIDPNVTGRPGVVWDIPSDQFVEKMVVLRLSGESNGNATGIGVTDIITERFAASIDFHAMYTNNLAASSLVGCRLPMVLPNDRDAIIAAVRTAFVPDPMTVRIVRIANTKHLVNVQVSQALADEVDGREDLEIVGPPIPWSFDEGGNLADL